MTRAIDEGRAVDLALLKLRDGRSAAQGWSPPSLLEESALDTLIACENDGLPLDTEHIPKRWYFHVPDRYRGQLNIGGDPDPHNPIIRRGRLRLAQGVGD